MLIVVYAGWCRESNICQFSSRRLQVFLGRVIVVGRGSCRLTRFAPSKDAIGQLDRRQVPPEHPIEECRVVIGLLRIVAVADSEPVGDLEQRALVLAHQLGFQECSPLLENTGEIDRRGPLVVLASVPASEQGDGMSNNFAGAQVRASSHGRKKITAARVSDSDQSPGVLAFVREPQPKVAPLEYFDHS